MEFNYNLASTSTSIAMIGALLSFAGVGLLILILSENNSYTLEERNKLYNEAIFNLQQASKLLKGMPHPASSMSYKLIKNQLMGRMFHSIFHIQDYLMLNALSKDLEIQEIQ